MLKIYTVKSMYKLNDDEWKQCGGIGYCCKDSDEIEAEKLVFKDCNFNQCQEFLKVNYIDGIWNCKSVFRHKPLLGINGVRKRIYLSQKDVQNISYKLIYTEWKEVTMGWIITHCSPEEVIAYLKHRDIQTYSIFND